MNKPQISASTGNITITGSTQVTFTAKNATSATYRVDNGTETGNKGNQETITATFTKEEQNTGSCVYFKNTDNWQQIFCYAWNSEPDKMTAWPGTAMKVYDETNQIYPELFIAVR